MLHPSHDVRDVLIHLAAGNSAAVLLGDRAGATWFEDVHDVPLLIGTLFAQGATEETRLEALRRLRLRECRDSQAGVVASAALSVLFFDESRDVRLAAVQLIEKIKDDAKVISYSLEEYLRRYFADLAAVTTLLSRWWREVFPEEVAIPPLYMRDFRHHHREFFAYVDSLDGAEDLKPVDRIHGLVNWAKQLQPAVTCPRMREVLQQLEQLLSNFTDPTEKPTLRASYESSVQGFIKYVLKQHPLISPEVYFKKAPNEHSRKIVHSLLLSGARSATQINFMLVEHVD